MSNGVQAQAETTGTENQNLFKTQTLTLIEKRKQFKENFIEQNQSEVKPKLQTAKSRDQNEFQKTPEKVHF